jgi:hypothetical protein
MPAPANDNWASATVVAGGSGRTTGTNVLSTAQAGEPANNGKTVWFKWDSTDNKAFFFSTVYDSTTGSPGAPLLRTVVRVYTGSAVNALTEVTYLFGGTWNQYYAGWEFGSFVSFHAAYDHTTSTPTTYYIRVDGVAGTEGVFPLTWGLYYPLKNAACDDCPSFLAPTDYVCQAVQSIPSVLSAQTVAFGSGTNYPAGKYYVAYCGGAFMNADPTSALHINGDVWVVYYDSGGISKTITQFLYNGGTAAIPLSGTTAAMQFTSQGDAEDDARCASAQFDHTGGTISVDYADYIVYPTSQGYSDDADGSPNPVYGLYRLIPKYAFVTACANWVTVGTSGTCTFTIANNGSSTWSNVSATLDTAGGISGSSTVSGITMAGLSSQNITLTFNCSTPNVTATLRLSSSQFPADVVFTIFLGPVLTMPSFPTSVGPGGFGSCSGRQFYGGGTSITNSGFWQYTGTQGLATIVFNSGVGGVNASCVLTGTLTENFTVACLTTGSIGTWHIQKPLVTTPTNLTITLSDASATLAMLNFNITVN